MADQLNPPQREAVQTLSGPLLVLAGAGTGKTRVVTYRIARLIRSGIAPERILAVTFTRKAAGEMQERVRKLLPKKSNKSKQRPQISTFHSLCVKILRRHISELGYPAKFSICDRGEQEAQARAALREIHCPAESLKPSDLLFFVGSWKNRSIEPQRAASLAESDKEHLAAAAYRRYQTNLKSKGIVDFDDLLLLVQKLFTKSPKIRREEAAYFDHVLIDEYQDTNGSQYEIVKGLAMGHRNLCVVGDDDQSIYGWRGAEVEHILNFHRDWPESKIVRLEDNYRSTAAILGYANTLIGFNTVRHDKVLKPARAGGKAPQIMQMQDETQEAQKIVADIKFRLSQPGVSARDFAILCRTNEQPRSFETELRRANLPYVLLGGMSFFDRKEVRDVLAYLNLLDNSNDEVSLLRIINTPTRGIGNSTVKQLVDKATQKGGHIWDLFDDIQQLSLPAAATMAVTNFRDMINTLRSHGKNASLPDLVNEVIRKSRYQQELDRVYPDPNEREARMATIEEIVNAAASYEQSHEDSNLRDFLDEIAMGYSDNTDEKENQLKNNAIALMTLHSAKGLEFPYVYMVGMEEGILPHKRSIDDMGNAIDEERRLCYVGVTRAQEELTLSLSLSRRKWGKARDTIPSRFLYEMTGQAEKAGKQPHVRSRNSRERRASR